MRKFIVNLLLFATIIGFSIAIVLYGADGYADAYYLRFTTPKQSSLIIGNSKSAQGLQPHVINKTLNADIYNYSFDISKSPYGPKYLESIKRKLNKKSRNGIFIVTVDCWSISNNGKNPNDTIHFSENNSCVGEMETVDQNPNFEYLIKYMSGSYYRIIFKSPIAFLHQNGWFEVSLGMDAASVDRRTNGTLLGYRKYVSTYKFSKVRYDYLIKTIDFLNQYGDVYIVRLPVSAKLMAIENQFAPHFNQLMKKPAENTSGFLDLTAKNSKFEYNDGVHLSKKSGRLVSKEIAKWILEQQQTNDAEEKHYYQ